MIPFCGILVPSFAIRSIDVVPGSNPVFGLNALGGAIVLNMKDGFNAPAGEQIDASGGSYGRARVVGEMADQFGNEAVYLGASVVDKSGWRRSSQSQLYQAYGDFAVRAPHASAGIALTLVTDSLNENGASPVQDFATAAFSIPDTAKDRDFLLQGRGEYDFSAEFVVRGSIYARVTHIVTSNGQASGFTPCASEPAILCDTDGDPLFTTTGASIASSIGGNGSDGIEIIATTALGASFEIDRTGTLFGLSNNLVLGEVLDRSYTGFNSEMLLANLTFQPGGDTTQSLGIYLGGPQYEVRLGTVGLDEGLYAQDTLALSSALSLEVSGQFHYDEIDLTDRLGTALTGNHDYAGINPALELAWHAASGITAYAQVRQSSRTPTAAELSCSNPAQPCLFPLSFISDPNLRQVVARTAELGAKGNAAFDGVSLDWSADVYGTRNQNDIIFESSGPIITSGYFANVGTTQRLGAEVTANAKWQKFELRANYGFVNATFESASAGPERVQSRCQCPRQYLRQARQQHAQHSAFLGEVQSRLCGNALAASRAQRRVGIGRQYLRGNEANLQRPLPGYVVIGAEADYRLSKSLQLYVEGDYRLDRRYATFGLYGNPTGNGAFPQFTNPRFIVPAQPFGFWAGVRVQF